jgi:hypothetical protein
MFQVWACKQVWGIAGTNRELLRWSDTNPVCPSCMQVPETCNHILHCSHEGRVDTLLATITLLDQWLKGNDTAPDLRECIYEYAMKRWGTYGKHMSGTWVWWAVRENGKGTRFNRMEKVHVGNGEQGNAEYQRTHASVLGMRHNTERWGVELVTRLLDWRSHSANGYIATFRYTAESLGPLLRRERKTSDGDWTAARAGDGRVIGGRLLSHIECNPGDLEETSVMKETYWLLAIKAAS